MTDWRLQWRRVQLQVRLRVRYLHRVLSLRQAHTSELSLRTPWVQVAQKREPYRFREHGPSLVGSALLRGLDPAHRLLAPMAAIAIEPYNRPSSNSIASK